MAVEEEGETTAGRSSRNRIRSRRGGEGRLEVFDSLMTLRCKINRAERDLMACFVGDGEGVRANGLNYACLSTAIIDN